MKINIRLLFFTFMLCAVLANLYAQVPDVFYHTVERGQTVYSIATMYGVKVDDIHRLNIGSEESIKVGDKLRIPQKKKAEAEPAQKSGGGYIYHTIQPKETLFGVSKKYNVTGEAIIQANPGLSKETFSIGKTIRIPTHTDQKRLIEVVNTPRGTREIYYTVPKKETIYNICRRFKTNSKELLKMNPELSGGLRVGMTLRIPLRISEKELAMEGENEQRVNEMLDKETRIKLVNAAKIAILLPFNAQNKQHSAMDNRAIEYYEGFLLAVDSLRHKGHSTELFVYDIGNNAATVKKILQDNESTLKNVNLIIGGTDNEQIKEISDFAQSNKVKYVIPFTSRNDEVLNNGYIFQVNTPHNYLYANAAYAAAKLFSKYNVIFLDTKDKDNQTEFIKEFKKELDNNKTKYKDLTYANGNILPQLINTKPNVIVPISRTLESLKKIKTELRTIADGNPEYQLTLFGYPIWQTYAEDCLEDFHALNTYIYSLFYADNMNRDVRAFYNNYKHWYSKNLMPALPKYGILGFDTGMYFLNAIQKYGSNFENNLDKISHKSIQTGFNFERVNNWGGFINTNIYIVHYDKNFNISRSDFK